ncbi:type II toxin-antitoxin system Phd/YefM family antitoxin [Solwaraspora sp. WMMD791]|uniref:type II toxin-antitoxin system Phd/YefM family antitoxin n=1 Tax=Solwaraspora sp. WMMD791 TaxID=3016086 RepID=UPI00249C9D6E|nr:type II toxin-antitoxin system Phd/YefM family antitoxin [Solwaraspora sp. WMMD791]WFE26715.1 type II toxin-antitoxin system Phd/YefM family antitoxin [Solwaraspora sp. WMMD791]
MCPRLSPTTYFVKNRRIFEITRHGRPVAVLISPDDLATLEETLDVLSSPEVMRQLAESRTAIAAGDVLDPDQVAALMAERAKRAGDQ